jgi:hypothetical protein
MGTVEHDVGGARRRGVSISLLYNGRSAWKAAAMAGQSTAEGVALEFFLAASQGSLIGLNFKQPPANFRLSVQRTARDRTSAIRSSKPDSNSWSHPERNGKGRVPAPNRPRARGGAGVAR